MMILNLAVLDILKDYNMTKKILIHFCPGSGGQITDEVYKFVDEYQQLNKNIV